MKILIGADIVPTKSNEKTFENAQMEHIVDEKLLCVIRSADFRIFNLEAPLTDNETPIKKCGPNLIASADSVNGLKQLGVDFLTLSNNHILDQGGQGLRSTIEQLKKASIAYAGVGENLTEAQVPYIREIGEKKVGIYCCAEHEFSIATKNTAGANPFDPLESLDHITELKNRCDYVICLYHGGKEHYRYPSPDLQRTCRKIVENGANLVICQHTHCIGCEEKYLDGTIVYGQGNFLFDHNDIDCWQTSVLVSVDLAENSVEYIAIEKNGSGVKLAENEQIITDMQNRSAQILKPDFIEKEYTKFAQVMLRKYMGRDIALFKLIPFRIIDKLCGHKISRAIVKRKIKKYRLLYINQYECEAHRELILRGLRS